MSVAVIGHTGFVGGHLARAEPGAECFNSKNIESIAGREYDRLLVAGMPGTKWLANAQPEPDRLAIERLARCLEQCRARQVVLLSTIDVYPGPYPCDEATPIDPDRQQPYGKHRLWLERRLAELFPAVTVIRLPGLFGSGLKKNPIFDLLNDHETHKIQSRGVQQYYPLARLQRDIAAAVASGRPLLNFATEPVSVAEVALEGLGLRFDNDPGTPAVRYDMRTLHADVFGATGHYMLSRDDVLGELRRFATAYREGQR